MPLPTLARGWLVAWKLRPLRFAGDVEDTKDVIFRGAPPGCGLQTYSAGIVLTGDMPRTAEPMEDICKDEPKRVGRSRQDAKRGRPANCSRNCEVGWILGGEAFRDRMLDLATAVVGEKKRESFSGEELRAYDESAARKLLESGLSALGETPGSVRPMRCNDPRKQALAWLIKRNTMAGDEWVTRELDMGHRSNVSRAVSAFRSESSRTRLLKRKLRTCTD